MSTVRRAGSWIAVSGLVAALLTSTSHAGARAASTETVVAVDGTVVTITAGPGVANRITLALEAGDLVLTDSASDVLAGAGCAGDGPAQARCSLAGISGVHVVLGDQNDVVAKPTALPVPVLWDGGDHSDTFVAAMVADGPDRYAGGAGSDTVTYAARADAVSVTIDGVADDGAAGEGDDVASEIENVIGGAGDDHLVGSDAANTLSPGAGDDIVDGRGGGDALINGLGDDTYNGGAGDDVFGTTGGLDGADDFSGDAGIDTVSYGSRDATEPVMVTIDDQPDDGYVGEGDNVRTDVENATGSAAADVLVGSAADNRLNGGAGADHIDGGAGGDREEGGDGDDTFAQGAAGNGSDAFVGGAGSDTVDYTERTNPVTGDADDVADDGESGEGDNVGSDVETIALPIGPDPVECPGFEGVSGNHIVGTDGDDSLTGTAGDDILCGLGGEDTLEGGDGRDVLVGGPGMDLVFGQSGDDRLVAEATPDGADLLSGGPGFDEVSYAARSTGVRVTVPELGTTLPGDDGAPGEGDGVTSTVEIVTGGSGDDTLSVEPCDCPPVGVGVSLHGGPGNDSITGGARFDALMGGDGDDLLVALAGPDGSDLFDGGAGFDTVSYAARSTGVHVVVGYVGGPGTTADDGAPGEGDDVTETVEAVLGGSGNDDLDLGGFLYDPDRRGLLYGGGGNDTLAGSSGPDELLGGDGDDRLIPGRRFQQFSGDGADRFSGGAGIDLVSYADEPTGVTVTIDGVANDGPSGTGEGDNVEHDVEQVIGTTARDVLSGSPADNLLVGGGGDDFLAGGRGDDLLTGNDGDDFLDAGARADGADQYFGGAGTDTISYASRSDPVFVDLGSPGGDGGLGEDDAVFGDVDVVIGGAGNDQLTGDAGDEELRGGEGDDRLDGGDGADVLSGGIGIDTVTYGSHGAGVTVSIDDAADDGVPGEGDDVRTDVENLTGSGHDDVLEGSSAHNEIRGGGGDDDVRGGPGNDRFVMEAFADGRDVVRGGAGVDIADYSRRFQPVDVRLGVFDQRGEDLLGPGDDVEGAVGGSGDDQLLDHRTPTASMPGARLWGEGGDDTISGVDLGGLDDRLDGGPGDDNIRGLLGHDTLLGGPGTDRLYGGLPLGGNSGDRDTIRGGSGNDFIFGDGDDDTLRGEAGNDSLVGGAGDDALLGGPGYDLLLGGLGVDTCRTGSDGGLALGC